jgi:hypothetical protein
LEEPPIDRLLRELEGDAIDKDDDTLTFVAPDRNTASKLLVDKYNGTLVIETVLRHSARYIDENIYMKSDMLSDHFSEEQIREIIDDISARLLRMELPEMLQNIKYGFKIVEEEEDYTKFTNELRYTEEELAYDALRDKVKMFLTNSFELIYGFLLKMGFFIHNALEQFAIQPEIQYKLLKIRALLFDAKFREEMTGRFARDQQRIARSIRKDAIELMGQFEENFPSVATDSLEKIRVFFEIEL